MHFGLSATVASVEGRVIKPDCAIRHLPIHSSSRRFQLLDGLRGLSCVLVIVNHSTTIAIAALPESSATTNALQVLLLTRPLGHLGVAFFFVISGYCIANSCERRPSTLKDAWHFLLQRFFRIYPTFWVCWFAIGVAYCLLDAMNMLHLMDRPSALGTSPLNLAPDQWLGNLTLTENWRHNVFGGSSPEMNVMGQMWTLCYEEQFYLFAFVSILLSRRLSRWCFVLFAAYLLIVCSTTFNPQSLPVLRHCLDAVRKSAPLIEGTVLDIHFLEFFSGVVCFWAVSTQRRFAKTLSLAAILLILTSFLLGWFGTRSYQFERIAALAFAAFLISIHSIDRQVSRAMFMVPLNWFGERCYSVYLSHVIVVTFISRIFLMAELKSPVITLLVVVPLCLVAASLVGSLTYRCVERPLVAYGKKAISK